MRHSRPPAFGFSFAAPLFIGSTLNPINSTMIVIALPTIATETGVDIRTAVWLVASLYVTSAVFQPAAGAIADRFGARRVFVAGLALVAAGGLLPLAWPEFTGALLARILLGIGTSAAYPSALTLVREREQLTAARPPQWLLAGLSIAALVSAAIGPVLGGALLALGSWLWIFVINTPIAVVALVLALRFLPADAKRTTRLRLRELLSEIDAIGILLFATTVTGTLVFLLELQDLLWPAAAIGAAAGTAFVFWERRQPKPFVDFTLFTDGPLVRTFARILLTFIAVYVFLFGFAPWTQEGYGLTGAESGLAQLPAALLALASAGVMARVRALPVPLAIGASAAMLGGAGLALLGADTPLGALILVAAAFGVAQGVGFVANQSVLYLQAPRERMATLAGLSRTAMYLGAILASIIVALAHRPTAPAESLRLPGIVVLVAGAAVLALVVTDRRVPRRL